VIDILWIGAIAVVTAAASYLSRIVGLLCLALCTLAALILWGMAAGEPIVLVGIILPSLVGFVVGRLISRTKAAA
jgi:uncharacterized membrane protein